MAFDGFFFNLAALSHQRRSVKGRFGNGGKHNRSHSMGEHRGRLFRSVSGAADKVMSHVPESRHTGAVTVQSCTSETRTPDRRYHDVMSISYRMSGPATAGLATEVVLLCTSSISGGCMNLNF